MCFFFQAEDGIRDYKVTGVQTCALPIYPRRRPARKLRYALGRIFLALPPTGRQPVRACRGGQPLTPERGVLSSGVSCAPTRQPAKLEPASGLLLEGLRACRVGGLHGIDTHVVGD